jgi:hypothetical protein
VCYSRNGIAAAGRTRRWGRPASRWNPGDQSTGLHAIIPSNPDTRTRTDLDSRTTGALADETCFSYAVSNHDFEGLRVGKKFTQRI